MFKGRVVCSEAAQSVVIRFEAVWALPISARTHDA